MQTFSHHWIIYSLYLVYIKRNTFQVRNYTDVCFKCLLHARLHNWIWSLYLFSLTRHLVSTADKSTHWIKEKSLDWRILSFSLYISTYSALMFGKFLKFSLSSQSKLIISNVFCFYIKKVWWHFVIWYVDTFILKDVEFIAEKYWKK